MMLAIQRSVMPNLGRGFAASLLLHAALLLFGARLLGLLPPLRPPAATPLDVRFAPPKAAAAATSSAPALRLPEDTAAAAAPAAPKPRERVARHLVRPAAKPAVPARAPGPRTLPETVARLANAQLARQLLYPPEAIAQGLEGETLVMLFLDDDGNVIAARVEASSGHPILDEAAVRAARGLRALPAGAPREALLPVRFRLR